MDTPKPLTGPYRATRLWNEAIRIFNNGVPRKRHWRQLKQYDNCFTASEATSWLHSQLKANPHFGPTVSKEQTQKLLCKFLKAGVFEDVRGVESKVEHFKDNSGLYRLTNRSPFRNPRTPGRTPLSSLAIQHNFGDSSGSPRLEHPRTLHVNSLHKALPLKSTPQCGKTLVQCHLTAKQLEQHEVEEIWKNTTLNQIAKLVNLSHLHDLDPSQTLGKWILWNVTHIGTRGVVQAMDDKDSPPSWVLYGMKSLVNWPSNEDHKLPQYQGSEKDVFKVICDYFTNVSSPLTTFPLYNIFVEAFIRSESTDLTFRKASDSTESEKVHSVRDSVQNLMIAMASPACRNMSTPIYSCRLEKDSHNQLDNSTSLPVMKSPLVCNRFRRSRIENEAQRLNTHNILWEYRNREDVPDSSHRRRVNYSQPNSSLNYANTELSQINSSACYETAFTTAEPVTRMISQANIARRSRSSDEVLNDGKQAPFSRTFHRRHNERKETSQIYYSLDRLRSKSGGYVNVAAFGSIDCLEHPISDKNSENSLWTVDQLSMNGHSVSSLSCHTAGTGLSPSSFAEASTVTSVNYGSASYSRPNNQLDLGDEILHYDSSPSKRLIGRRKGLEFYYGAKACKPDVLTPEGKAMAIEILQLLTLLLPPDRRRKLHLILRFMAKVSANEKLALDSEIPIKTLVVNTFYRCIISSPEEADYDELLAVRLVTFLMENAESIMTVPPNLCSQVRDLLITIQREKIRFQLDDVVPLTYCRQVSSKRFEQQGKNESEVAIRELLEHIINDQQMSAKEKRKRLTQFQTAYPEIYLSRFPSTDITAEKSSKKFQPQEGRSMSQSTMINRIRNLRLI